MSHWVHRSIGRGRRLAAYAADELPPADRASLEAQLLACHACRRDVEAYRLVSGTLRSWPRVALATDQSGAFWSGVERRTLRGAGLPARPARPALREIIWDHPRLSLASAAAAVVLVVGFTLGQIGVWGPTTGMNGVEVVSVEAGDDESVMVFQAPGSSLKVIWVFEKPSS